MPSSPNGGRFRTTRWSLVRRAGREEPEARAALEELCELYWPAVYAYLRRRGEPREDALDRCQGLFTRLLERGDFASVDPEKGSFRAWLKSCARHHAANVHAHESAEKRGGDRAMLSIDPHRVDDTEGWFEPAHDESPDKVFDRVWARTILQRSVHRLREEQQERGRESLFDALEPRLRGETDRDYESVAEEFGVTPGAIKVLAYRLRQRLRELIVREVRHTTHDHDDGVDELERLACVLDATARMSS